MTLSYDKDYTEMYICLTCFFFYFRNSEPDEQDFDKSNSRKRPRDAVQKEEEMEGDYQENWKASSSQSYSPDHRQKKHKKLSEPERTHKVSHVQERRDERKRCHRVSPVYSSDHESSDYGHVQSPPSSASPHQMSMDHYRSPEEDHEPFVSHQKPGKGHSNAFQDRLGVSQDRHLGDPQGKGLVVSQNKEHRPYKEKRPADARGDGKSSLSREKSHKSVSKEENRRPLSGDSAKEKPLSGVKKEKEKEGSTKKKSLPPLEVASDNHLKNKPKHRDPEKTKSDKNKQSPDSCDVGKGDPLPKVKERVSNNLKTPEGKVKASRSDRKPSLAKVEEADGDDEFEQPTMSFESYLSYDQPRKKKKKIVKASTTTPGEKGLKKNDSKSTNKNSDSIQKLPKVNENKSEKLQAAGADSAKLKKVSPSAPGQLPSGAPGPWSSRHLPGRRRRAWLAFTWPVEFEFEVTASRPPEVLPGQPVPEMSVFWAVPLCRARLGVRRAWGGVRADSGPPPARVRWGSCVCSQHCRQAAGGPGAAWYTGLSSYGSPRHRSPLMLCRCCQTSRYP